MAAQASAFDTARSAIAAFMSCASISATDAVSHAVTLTHAFRDAAVSDAAVTEDFVWHLLHLIKQANENDHAAFVRCLNNAVLPHERLQNALLRPRTHTHTRAPADPEGDAHTEHAATDAAATDSEASELADCLGAPLRAPDPVSHHPILALSLLRFGARVCSMNTSVRRSLARIHTYAYVAAQTVELALGRARVDVAGGGGVDGSRLSPEDADIVAEGCKLLYVLALTEDDALLHPDVCTHVAAVIHALLLIREWERSQRAATTASATACDGTAGPRQQPLGSYALQLLLVAPDAWLVHAHTLPRARELACDACIDEVRIIVDSEDAHGTALEFAAAAAVTAALHVARRLTNADVECRSVFRRVFGIRMPEFGGGSATTDDRPAAASASAESPASGAAAATASVDPASRISPALRACLQTLADGIKTSAEELLYDLCDKDTEAVVHNVGFGLAAGLLAAKGAIKIPE